MLGIVMTAVLLVVYLLVAIAYGLRRAREKEARESEMWPTVVDG